MLSTTRLAMSTRAQNFRWLTRIKSVNSAGQLWQWMGLSAENELWWMIDCFLPNCPEGPSWTVFATKITWLPTNDTNKWPRIMKKWSRKWWLWWLWWLWWSVLWSKILIPTNWTEAAKFSPLSNTHKFGLEGMNVTWFVSCLFIWWWIPCWSATSLCRSSSKDRHNHV